MGATPQQSLLLLQPAAGLLGAGGVESGLTFLDVLDFPFLVDDERGAIGEPALGVVDAVVSRNLAHEVAQQREGDPEFLGPMLVRGPAIDADSENLRDRKSTRLNSSHLVISYAVFCLKK